MFAAAGPISRRVVDVDAVAASALAIPGVGIARAYKYMCSNPGQKTILDDVREQEADPRGGCLVQPSHA